MTVPSRPTSSAAPSPSTANSPRTTYSPSAPPRPAARVSFCCEAWNCRLDGQVAISANSSSPPGSLRSRIAGQIHPADCDCDRFASRRWRDVICSGSEEAHLLEIGNQARAGRVPSQPLLGLYA